MYTRADIRKFLSPPETLDEVRSFLSTAAYSSKFIKNMASISAPLRNLTRRETGGDVALSSVFYTKINE